MNREIGSAVKPCPDCGASLPVVDLPDGAVTSGGCECSVVEVASEAPVALVREYGWRDEDGE